jgi:glycosylphosphatidylinositol transamidase (GPIT) subunit GPI8
VKDGTFVITDYITTAGVDGQTKDGTQSAARTLASESHRQDIEGGIKTDLPPKDQSWALVAATSSDWQNYRHQADALAQYTMLKAQGFDDDHIVLAIRDDISTAKKNPLPGQVRNITMGANLRENAQIDYSGAGLNASALMGILKGDPVFPERINSDFNDNIYVFLVGHGGNQGMFVDIDDAAYSVSSGENVLSPLLLANTIAEMHKNKRYRRMLIVVEACHSGALGASLTAPNALLMTAASAAENSLATNFALEIGEWVADQFAFSLYQLSTTEPALPLPEIYRRVYSRVSGSHVSVFNTKTFSELAVTPLGEFVLP